MKIPRHAGAGTGSVAELILSGQLRQPGVWLVEQALDTELFTQTMQNRQMKLLRLLRRRFPPGIDYSQKRVG